MQVSPFDCMHGPAWNSQIYPPPNTSRPIISIMGSVWKVVGHELVGATPHPCTPWDIRRGPMRCRDAVAWRANWWRSEEAIWQRKGRCIPFPLISFNFYSRYALPFGGLVMSSYFELKGPFGERWFDPHSRSPTLPCTFHRQKAWRRCSSHHSFFGNWHPTSMMPQWPPSPLPTVSFAFLNSARKLPLGKSPVTWHSLWDICPFELHLRLSMWTGPKGRQPLFG